MRHIWCFASALLVGLILTGCGDMTLNRNTNILTNIYGQPVLLTHYPIEIVINRNLSDSQMNSVIQAIDKWNNVAESDLLLYRFGSRADAEATQSVWLTVNSLGHNDENEQILGLTVRNFMFDGSSEPIAVRAVRIEMWDHLINSDWYAVALHELGHVLGLNHDDDMRQSIMYPYATVSDGEITPDDARFVRRLGRIVALPNRNTTLSRNKPSIQLPPFFSNRCEP